jgi:N-acetyl-gamma-glutamyl-phosphate reductase
LNKVKVIIVGGTGYGAGELIKLLLAHPAAEVVRVCSRSHIGREVCEIHSHLASLTSLTFSSIPTRDELLKLHATSDGAATVVFLALPSGVSGRVAGELLGEGLPSSIKIIDLSGDLRLKDEAKHAEVYPEVPFSAQLRSKFTYLLPDAHTLPTPLPNYISNPGCLATASILALRPFCIGEYTFKGRTIVDGKTGTSGAGRDPSATMHHPIRSSDFTAYKVLSHRHEPEISQALLPWSEPLVFVPHLIPTSRGIFVTVYGELEKSVSNTDLLQHVKNFYSDSYLIRVRPSPPRLVDVVGTSFCDISVAVRGKEVVVMAAIDNLGKGMVGTAIQNMNIICGLPSLIGLKTPALGPV